MKSSGSAARPWGIFTIIGKSLSSYNEDNAFRMAAAVAFYTMISIAPMLVIAIRVAGAIFGPKAARHQMSDQLRDIVGPQAAAAIETMLQNADKAGSGGTLASVIGIALLLYGATNVFTEIQDSMNTIWEVKPNPKLAWWEFMRVRLMSFTMVLSIAFLLMVSLVVSAGLAAAAKLVGTGETGFWQAVNFAISLGVFTGLFALMFRFLPDAKVRWGDVWIGAVSTGLLFTGGKYLIGLYLARSSVASVYGAAGSLAVLLIWVYYSAQILFLGAEFTQVYSRRYGTPIVPDEKAVKLTEADRLQEGIPHEATLRAAAGGQRENLLLIERSPSPWRAIAFVTAAIGLIAWLRRK